jgi:hypothetical protein
MSPAELNVPMLPGNQIGNVHSDVTPARPVSGWVDADGISHGGRGPVMEEQASIPEACACGDRGFVVPVNGW